VRGLTADRRRAGGQLAAHRLEHEIAKVVGPKGEALGVSVVAAALK